MRSRFFKSFTKTKLLLALGLSAYGTSHIFTADSSHKSQKKVTLYSWGYNNFGQLGLGHEISKALPMKVEELSTVAIFKIACKNSVSAAITEDGSAYTWGQSKGGILGHDNNTNSNVSLPTTLELSTREKLTHISVGSKHVAAINDKGELFTWGSNEHGQLGHSEPQKEKSSKSYEITRTYMQSSVFSAPKKVESILVGKKVVQVSCGTFHTICLTEDGDIYTWGRGKRGVLGFKTEIDEREPKKVPTFANKKVVKIECGADFNIAMTEDGKLWSWGSNDYGQLGKSTTAFQESPSEISAISVLVKDFSCGDYYAGALSKEGHLYTWGFGNDGQLGHKNRTDVKSPKQVDFDKKISVVSCGNGHTALITEKGELYMFGRGKEGQLGREEENESSAGYRTTPKHVEAFKNKRVVNVKCGGEHTMALVEE